MDEFTLTVVDGRLAWRHTSGRILPHVAGGDGPVGTGIAPAEHLRAEARAKLEQAQEIATKAHDNGRPLTSYERSRVEALLADVHTLNEERKGIADSIALTQQIDELNAKMITGGGAAGVDGAGGFADALLKAGLGRHAGPGDGFSVKGNPSVVIPAFPTFGSKAPTLPAVTDIARSTPVGLEPLGRDERFMYQAMRQINLGADLSIQDFRETVRTTTGTVERDPLAVTGKATLGVTVVAVNTAVKQEAVILDGIPNAVLESLPSFREFANGELRFRIAQALDAHVYSAVNTGATFGTTGTTMIEKLRNAITAVQADGFTPDLAVLNPTDAAALDLSADAGGFVFPVRDTGQSSPLWGLRVVVRIGAGTEPPLVVDTSRIGALYLGTLSLDLDPFAGVAGNNFATNRTDIRAEVNTLMHVRSAKAARRIAAT